jgi:hypothetical protein
MSDLPKEVQEKLAVVDLGLRATEFVKGPVGARMVERIQHKVEELTTQLKTMDILKDPLAATRVQVEMQYAENFLYWMAEMITEGTEVTGELLNNERASEPD